MQENRIVTELFFEKPSFAEVSAVAKKLEEAGVNSLLLPPDDRGINTHLIVETAELEKAKSKLNEAGVPFSEKEVLLVRLENKPGTMADVTIKISNKGINLTYAFAVAVDAEHSILLIGSEDNEAALKVISS